jgi:hypothetical protein
VPTLSPEQILKVTGILTHLDAHPLPAAESERRHSRRVPLRTPLQITLLSDAHGHRPPTIDVYSRNISSAGMAFVCRRMFRPDERLAISLIIGPLPQRLLLGRITFSRYVKAGLYEMGAEFLACIPHPAGADRIPLSWFQTSKVSAAANTQTPPGPPPPPQRHPPPHHRPPPITPHNLPPPNAS